MPKYFHFHTPQNNFNGQLQSQQCEFILVTGNRCRRRCLIGLPMCRPHLEKRYHVEIKQSTIPNAGLGLFVKDRTRDDNEVIFRANDTIVPYSGELLPNGRQTILNRYGMNTAPYGIAISEARGDFEDGALRRGVGTLVNHKPHSQANSRIGITNTQPRKAQIKATKNIRNGQEIFASYGNTYNFNENVETSTNNWKYNI